MMWFRWLLVIGLCLSASASAGDENEWLGQYSARFHKQEYRLVFPQFPPAELQTDDTVKLVLKFERPFPLTALQLAWNGRSSFSNASLRKHAKWTEERNGAVLEVDLTSLFQNEKQSFHSYVNECVERNGRFEIWWRAPVRLLDGQLFWGREGGVDELPIPPRVVVEQAAPGVRFFVGNQFAIKFKATPGADFFECAYDGSQFERCQSPYFASPVKRGWHSLRIRATNDETVGPVYRRDFLALGRPPMIVLQKAVPATATINGTSLVLTFEDRKNRNKKVAREIVCELDTKAFACKSPVAFNGLADGAHIVRIYAPKAKSREAPLLYAFRVEKSPPILSVTAFPPELTNQTTAAFSFSADRVTGFQCALDGQNPSACVSPWNLSQLTEGAHRAEIRAVDENGSTSEPFDYSWNTDYTAPSFTFAANPALALLRQGSLSLSYSASEPIRNVGCFLDGNPLAVCASPIAMSNVPDGSHRFTFQAADLAGNVGRFAYDFRVDSLYPTVEIHRLSPAASPSNFALASFEFSASKPSRFACSLDGQPPAPCTSPVDFAGLTTGNHVLIVSAEDEAGNVSQAQAAWLVDRVAPVVNAVFPQATVTESRSLSVDVIVSKIATLFYQLDGGAELPFVSPLVLNDLIEGTHRLQIRAQDPAGNISQITSYQWMVALPASVNFTNIGHPEAVTTAQENTFAFAGTNAVKYRCALDSAPFAECVSPVQVGGLADGFHNFQVVGVNLAGIAGVAAAHAWRIEAPPAIVTLAATIANGASSPSQDIGFTFSSNGSNLECALDGQAFAPCSSPRLFSGLGDGPHGFRVFARNVRGAAGVETGWSWTVATPAAVVTLGAAIPSQSLTNQQSISLAFTFSGGTATCSLDGAAAAPCASPIAYSGLNAGSHSISIQGRSAGGTLGTAVQYAWTVDLTVPVVFIDSTNPVNSLTSVVFMTATFHADVATASFLCALDGGTPQACSSPWTTAVVSDGPHAIAIWGLSLAGNQSAVPAVHNWTVDRQFTCTNFSVAQVTSTQYLAQWSTQSGATSIVRYGFGNNRAQTATGTDGVTQHSVLLTNLGGNTFYSAQGQSQNGGLSCATSAIFFTTPP